MGIACMNYRPIGVIPFLCYVLCDVSVYAITTQTVSYTTKAVLWLGVEQTLQTFILLQIAKKTAVKFV
jgi:hypothetical protein